ncbi:MAG: metallophosphoesterase [Sphingomonas bacterium]|nr:metallophosphoesterase [Sphingomonas bacterium]
MIPQHLKSWLSALLLLVGVTLTGAPALAGPGVTPARIVAIGDLHGDFDAWRAIARAAKLIDDAGRWTGQKTVLVQTGDIVDRGPDSLKIIRDLMRLEREAARAGGRVIVLVGNHEAMMVTDDLRYVHPGEFAAFVDRQSARRRDQVFAANRLAIEAAYRRQDATLTAPAIRDRWLARTKLGQLEYEAAWAPTGELGRWIIGKPAIVRLGSTLFVHGGLSPAYAAVPLDDINRRVKAALLARETAVESIINDPAGPLWYRGLAGLPVEGAPAPAVPLLPIAEQLDIVLKAAAAQRIVIGHTPLLRGVQVSEGGRLVRIDSGISRAYSGVPGYVEILGERVFTHNVPRPPGTAAGGKP